MIQMDILTLLQIFLYWSLSGQGKNNHVEYNNDCRKHLREIKPSSNGLELHIQDSMVIVVHLTLSSSNLSCQNESNRIKNHFCSSYYYHIVHIVITKSPIFSSKWEYDPINNRYNEECKNFHKHLHYSLFHNPNSYKPV